MCLPVMCTGSTFTILTQIYWNYRKCSHGALCYLFSCCVVTGGLGLVS